MKINHQPLSLKTNTIAVVDDNAEFCLLLQRYLQAKGYDVEVFSSSSGFLSQNCAQYDLILLDLFMPDPDGITVIRQLAQFHYAGAVVLMSGEDQGVLRAALELSKAQRLQNIVTIKKPFALAELGHAVSQLLSQNPIRPVVSGSGWLPDAQAIAEAIRLCQLQLYYQPKIRLIDNVLTGFEALVRWHHPEHGLIMPDRFIPLAEQSMKLMELLTGEVIRLAIAQLAMWQQQGIEVDVSINISMLNLVSLDFPEQLQHKMQQHQLLAQRLQLEVTETALMNEVASSLDILLRLKMRGFSLSIDDFGTGYSSLAQLNRIPFNELKIDGSFVMTMLSSNDSRAIVETCIQLAKRLGLKVVAEGVENEQVLQQLIDMGCDIGQGYFWSKALPAPEASIWFSRL